MRPGLSLGSCWQQGARSTRSHPPRRCRTAPASARRRRRRQQPTWMPCAASASSSANDWDLRNCTCRGVPGAHTRGARTPGACTPGACPHLALWILAYSSRRADACQLQRALATQAAPRRLPRRTLSPASRRLLSPPGSSSQQVVQPAGSPLAPSWWPLLGPLASSKRPLSFLAPSWAPSCSRWPLSQLASGRRPQDHRFQRLWPGYGNCSRGGWCQGAPSWRRGARGGSWAAPQLRQGLQVRTRQRPLPLLLCVPLRCPRWLPGRTPQRSSSHGSSSSSSRASRTSSPAGRTPWCGSRRPSAPPTS